MFRHSIEIGDRNISYQFRILRRKLCWTCIDVVLRSTIVPVGCEFRSHSHGFELVKTISRFVHIFIILVPEISTFRIELEYYKETFVTQN